MHLERRKTQTHSSHHQWNGNHRKISHTRVVRVNIHTRRIHIPNGREIFPGNGDDVKVPNGNFHGSLGSAGPHICSIHTETYT